MGNYSQRKKRPGGPIPPIVKAFEAIGMAKVSKSAVEAKELLFLAHSDSITMNKNRLLADAKALALSLCKNYTAHNLCLSTARQNRQNIARYGY